MDVCKTNFKTKLNLVAKKMPKHIPVNYSNHAYWTVVLQQHTSPFNQQLWTKKNVKYTGIIFTSTHTFFTLQRWEFHFHLLFEFHSVIRNHHIHFKCVIWGTVCFYGVWKKKWHFETESRSHIFSQWNWAHSDCAAAVKAGSRQSAAHKSSGTLACRVHVHVYSKCASL